MAGELKITTRFPEGKIQSVVIPTRERSEAGGICFLPRMTTVETLTVGDH